MNLVTGGSGLVGSHLLLHLLEKKEQVRALIRSEQNKEQIKKIFTYYGKLNLIDQIDWAYGELLDVNSLDQAFDGVEYVYHSAAIVSFERKDRHKMYKVNIEGTANIVNACLDHSIKKLCHVSSTASLGISNDGALVDEDTEWKETKETSPYSISKHYSEREVWRGAEEGLDVVIVNPCVIIGPGEWGRSSTSFFPTVWKGMKYYTSGGNAFVDVNDLVKIMHQLTHSDVKSERYLVVGENMTYRKFFSLVAESLDKKAPYQKVNDGWMDVFWRLDWLKSTLTGSKRFITKDTAHNAITEKYFSNDKIKSIGFEFTPIEESVKETAKHFVNDQGKN
ncbi:MAG: NAD-dependent epimerase/dehydratase family protein [Flavobacteriales bacterium]|nr:NAD-dependent epimerase/dehydratase family protein [Flavobacteriales bacterium]